LHGPVAVDGQKWPKIIADTPTSCKPESVSLPTRLDAPNSTAGNCDKSTPSVQQALLEFGMNQGNRAAIEHDAAQDSGRCEMALAFGARGAFDQGFLEGHRGGMP